MPLSLSGNSNTEVTAPGRTSPGERLFANFNAVTPGYCGAAGVALRGGRPFDERDQPASLPVAIVNEELARRLWPGLDPVGRVFRTFGKDLTVAGVARNGKYIWLGERQRPFLYVPLAQSYTSWATLVVRTPGDPRAMREPLRRLLNGMDPHLPAPEVLTMEEQMSLNLLPSRIAGYASGGFGALALALVGIYGMVWYTVASGGTSSACGWRSAPPRAA